MNRWGHSTQPLPVLCSEGRLGTRMLNKPGFLRCVCGKFSQVVEPASTEGTWLCTCAPKKQDIPPKHYLSSPLVFLLWASHMHRLTFNFSLKSQQWISVLWGCKSETVWKQPQSTQSRWRANTYLALQRLNFCKVTLCFGHTAAPRKQNAAAVIFPECCRWHQQLWVKGSTSDVSKSFLINGNWKSLQHQNKIKDPSGKDTWYFSGKIAASHPKLPVEH